MTLFWYLTRNYVKTFVMILFFILCILLIIDGIDQYGKLQGYDAGIGQTMLYIFLRVPSILYQFFPLVFLITSLVFFLNLARHSELVIMRAAGLSALRVVLMTMVTTFVLSLLIIGPYFALVVSTRNLSENLFNNIRGLPSQTIRAANNGIWLREEIDNHPRFMFIDGVRWKRQDFVGVEVFELKEDQPTDIYYARNAKIDEGNLILNNVEFSEGGMPEVKTQKQVTLQTKQNFDDIFALITDPRFIQLYDLPAFAQKLDEDGYDSKPARTVLYSELSNPLFFCFLCLLGAVFALAPMRGGGTSRRVLTALITGFIFYGLTKLTVSMAKVGDLPIIIGVAAIPLAGFLLSFSLLLHNEDG